MLQSKLFYFLLFLKLVTTYLASIKKKTCLKTKLLKSLIIDKQQITLVLTS